MRLFLLFFIIFNVLLTCLITTTNGDTKCLQIDIMFALSISNTIDPLYYNTTVKSFVKTITDAFSTSDEVAENSKNFARFSILQSSGWISQHISTFKNRTRSEVNDMIDMIKYDIVDEHHDSKIEEQMSRSVWNLQGDWNHYGITTVTPQRVLFILTDRINYDDEYNKMMYLHQVNGRWPVIFGIGVDGIDGNLVEKNITSMIEVVNNHPERAFKNIDDALDKNTGVLSIIDSIYQCNTQTCSGFAFLFEDADMNWVDGKIFLDSTAQIMKELNSSENGFYVQDTFGIHYSPMVSDVDTSIRHINYYQLFTGFFGDYQNYTRSTIFDLMLQIINSGMYNNYGFFILSQTDTDSNYKGSIDLAYKLALTNVPIYVLDASTSYYNTQESFKIITQNKPERLINMSNILDTNNLVDYLTTYLLPEFNQLKCLPIKPITTNKCGGLIFISEMTIGIKDNYKIQFFNLSKIISSKIKSKINFSFSQFGIQVYHPIDLMNIHDFNSDVQQLLQSFNKTKQPNGQSSYMQPILSELINFLQSNSNTKFKIIMMAAQEYIRDPTTAYQLATTVSTLNSDIYVLDYSFGVVPVTIFPTLTGNKSGHVINATNLTTDEIIANLSSIIDDLNNDNC